MQSDSAAQSSTIFCQLRPGSAEMMDSMDLSAQSTESVPRNEGAARRFLNLVMIALASGLTLAYLLISRLSTEILQRTAWCLKQLRVTSWLLRRPLVASIFASWAGTAFAAIDMVASPSQAFQSVCLAGSVACALLLGVTAPNAFAVLCDPETSPKGWLHNFVRQFYSRAGRHDVDGAWLDVLLVGSVLITGPLVAILATPDPGFGALLIYVAAVWSLRTPLVNFEHGDSHYSFFRPRRNACLTDAAIFRAIDWFSKYPLAIITVRIPNWYGVQHVAIHHAENNGLADTQSTAYYDRASFIGFACCAQQFALSGLVPIELAYYLIKTRRAKPLRQLMIGYVVYMGALALLAFYSPIAAVLLLLVRYAGLLADCSSFFQEHGLLDPDHPDEIVTNSLHYNASGNEHGNRGEDLHIEHHLRPGLHWSLYPGAMLNHLEDYARLHAISYPEGVDHMRSYYRMLWRGDFSALAEHVGVFGGEGMTHAQVVELLRHRTSPVSSRCVAPAWLERSMAQFAAFLI